MLFGYYQVSPHPLNTSVASVASLWTPPSCRAFEWVGSIAYFTRGLEARSLSQQVFELRANGSSDFSAMGGCTISVIVRQGAVYVIPAKAPTGWTKIMVDYLLLASQTVALPDAHFTLTCSDWPMLSRARAPGAVHLGMNSGDSTWDIPVPGHSHPNTTFLRTTPWASRAPKALWRGTLMCEAAELKRVDCSTRCSRIQIRRAAAARPDLLDVRFTNLYMPVSPCIELLVKSLEEFNNSDVARNNTLSFEAQATRSKFMIASAGHSYASGYKAFLSSGAAVFRERTNFLEYFEPSLVPWRHYIPFDCRHSETDCELIALVEALRDSDSARLIGERAQAWAQLHFTDLGRSCYWLQLLTALQPFYEGGSGTLENAVGRRLMPLALRYEG